MVLRIAIDGMGGDRAPEMVVEGMKLAMEHAEVKFLVFGDEGALKGFLPSSPPSVSIVHAPQRIDGGESGILAVLKRPRSSLALAMKALAAKEVDAVVSAGDSRAVVAMAKHYVGLIGKVRRPVLGVFVPITPEKEFLLVDAGAYTGFHAVPLVQAALVGQVYWRLVKGPFPPPKVALLNIGREKFKGPIEVRRAASILQRLQVDFIGFMEPQDIFSSSPPPDVLVTNGFVGNIFLKLYESLSEHLIKTFELFAKSLCGIEFRNYEEWQEWFDRYRYEWTGGVPLLGVRKPVVLAHGRSGALAICRAIEKAIEVVKSNLTEQMEVGVETDPALRNISLLYRTWAVSALGGNRRET
ncbi:MAG: hypothetical protein N2260_00380 [Syntrophobacterales bacterium]|nr:hypothetical protein [Syntrophobacterales bacterium]